MVSACGKVEGERNIISRYLPTSPLNVSVLVSPASLIFKLTAALPIICPASVNNNSTELEILVG